MLKIGLVLSGGGGKGAYQIGVWKALKHFGLDKYISGISGTSIGALNAALILQNDFELAERVWNNISYSKVLTTKQDNLVDSLGSFTNDKSIIEIIAGLVESGVFTRDGLVKIINENLDLSKISNSPLECWVCCCEMPFFTARYFNLQRQAEDRILKILLASSAIPLFFSMEEIDGKYYLDGGIRNNVPVKPLYDAGLRRFIVVHLKADSKIDRGDFPGSKFIEIFPADDIEFKFRDTFDFSPEGASRRFQLGYEDAMRILDARIRKQ